MYTYTGNEYRLEIDEKTINIIMDGVSCARLKPDAAVEKFASDIPDVALSSAFSAVREGEYVWDIAGKAWNKRITLAADRNGFDFRVKITGKGRIGKINYFASVSGDGIVGSEFDFYEYYVPIDGLDPKLDRINNSLRSYRSFCELLVPSPLFFTFSTEDVKKKFSLALIAEKGRYNFIEYNYETDGRFRLTTTMEGLTEADGEYDLPFIRFFISDSYDSAADDYAAYNYGTGLCASADRSEMPRWWRGPFICGWGEQPYYAQLKQTSMTGACCQDLYERIIEMSDERKLKPSVLIIDDKWQKSYGLCLPDKEKWPDMRGFIDRMHKRGIRVLLWFRFWCPEGLDDSCVMPGGSLPSGYEFLKSDRYADPSNPNYRRYLSETVHTLLSDGSGCFNADGFKLDYAFVMPYGPTAHSYGGLYGIELLKCYIKLIYDAAKDVKPDALINCSPCHPYFNEVCDQARLHDPGGFRNHKQIMAYRSRLYRAMMPGVLVDSDTADFTTHDTAMRYYRIMPEIGAPDIYRFSSFGGCDLNGGDWDEIRKMYNGYAEEMDRIYGKDVIG